MDRYFVEEWVGLDDQCTGLLSRQFRERRITFVFCPGGENDDPLSQRLRRLIDFTYEDLVICIVRIHQETDGCRLRGKLVRQLQPFCYQLHSEYTDACNIAVGPV